MREILKRWQHKRILKGLGQLEPQHVEQAEQNQKRWQHDALTGRVFTIERGGSFITAGKPMPKVPISKLGGV